MSFRMAISAISMQFIRIKASSRWSRAPSSAAQTCCLCYRRSRRGQAIAVLPSYVAYQDDALVPVLPAEINFRRSLYVLTHEDNKNLSRVRTVSDFIFSEVQKNRPTFLPEAVFDPSEQDVAAGSVAIVTQVGPSCDASPSSRDKASLEQFELAHFVLPIPLAMRRVIAGISSCSRQPEKGT